MRLFKMTLALLLVSVGFLSLINEEREPEVGLAIGNKAPEIRTTLVNGSYFNLEDLKGQMVLIDFWASYDATSRIENHSKANLVETFGKRNFLNANGFTIVSISLDRFKTPLARAIEADKLEYPFHICDYKGRESDFAKLYGAQELRKYLIDGNGRIVSVSGSLEQISKTLERLTKG